MVARIRKKKDANSDLTQGVRSDKFEPLDFDSNDSNQERFLEKYREGC